MAKTSEIREHMEVIASCGKHVGVVDQVDGDRIKLTKNDPEASKEHHYIPVGWVGRVDRQVHLTKNSEDVFENWQHEPVIS
ncbi:DUF2171 domain-containing protein [Anatilimnocola floriformis]|uniref:DUF2171 domain-containing protein n=1 Tax=Anatilimnocola floriformis TaxID=2948575 RepID=UPI0020C40461|nr:DUF2171 domain-containing protein [Anatilimnocola floriformis]